MSFLRGEKCQLRVLMHSDEEANIYTESVNAGWTLQYLFTGSTPIRPIDVKKAWEHERDAGSIELGIWIPCDVKGSISCMAGREPEWKFIGTTGIYSRKREYREGEFRIVIFDPSAVSKGIGKEATWLITDYFFRRLNGWRCYLGVNEQNVRAVKCYEGVGYIREGLLRDAVYAYGKYNNAVRMSMLRPEWELQCKARGLETCGPIPDGENRG